MIFRHFKNQPPGRIFLYPVIGGLDLSTPPYCHLRTFISFVIFGLDPEIREYIRTSFILDLCAALTRSLRSGPPVGVAFGPAFAGLRK